MFVWLMSLISGRKYRVRFARGQDFGGFLLRVHDDAGVPELKPLSPNEAQRLYDEGETRLGYVFGGQAIGQRFTYGDAEIIADLVPLVDARNGCKANNPWIVEA